jgi:hypothetical protein
MSLDPDVNHRQLAMLEIPLQHTTSVHLQYISHVFTASLRRAVHC